MKKVLYSAALILSLSLAACSDITDYSPQEILNQAMQETSETQSYYGEYKISLGDGTEIVAKQWEKNGKNRIEMTELSGDETLTINDGKLLTTYSSLTNTATVFELGIDTNDLVKPNLKEQALRTFELIKDSHDITIGEDEKIAGHDTYHLIAKAKKEGTLIGNMEIWVDKKTWMTLKTISTSGDITMTSEYTKFEPNAKIEDSMFVTDLPEDATIETETIELPKSISIEEAKEKLDSFLIVPEKTGYTLDKIEDMNVEETGEIALSYIKDGNQQFNLSIFKALNEVDDNEEPIEVRGMKGSKMDMDSFRLLQWEENGLRYNVLLENPDLSFEDFLTIAGEMELVGQQ